MNTDYNPIKLNITKFIDSLDVKDYDCFKKTLKSKFKTINFKDNHESLVLINNNFNYNNHLLSDIEKECRSIILDKRTLEIICYTYDDIIYNENAQNFLIENDHLTKEIYESYEGTQINIYHHDDEWYISTRRCIDSKKSIWNNNKSFYELFLDCLDDTFDEFISYLNEDNIYSFVIIHHENKNLIDYTYKFGPEYKEIIHIMTRRKNDLYEYDISDASQWGKPCSFKNSESYKDFSKLDDYNKTEKLDYPLDFEGLIIKLYDNSNGKKHILKLQSNSYNFFNKIKPNYSNIISGFVHLYQNNNLKNHIDFFPSNKYIVHENMNYDTIGIIDASFKVFTSELLEMFKYFYNLKNCSHKNSELYEKLPVNYKKVLYKIRGIYYEKKENYINSKKNKTSLKFNMFYCLRISDIYNLLKEYNTNELFKLFRDRQIINSPDSLFCKLFLQFSKRCDNKLLKMINILLQKI